MTNRPRSLAAGVTAGLLLVGTPALAGAVTPPTSTEPSPALDAAAGTRAATPTRRPTTKVPTMTGAGGAVSSVDETATAVGIDVLRRGGNAVDAAVATAATLGVTEPFSSGIGGGGFFVYYDAGSGRVHTIDGRETAPRAFTPTTLTDGAGKALEFDEVVSSGLSVGVPGTPATWDAAVSAWGTRSLGTLLAPAEKVARRGFTVDAYYRSHTASNAKRFAMFPDTAELFLPGGAPPAVGSTFRNPDLARTYRQIARHGVDVMYRGRLGKDVVAAATRPRTAPGLTVRSSPMTPADVAAYRVRRPAPVVAAYRDLQIVGMGAPSSGGIAVGEILGLMEAYAARTKVSTAAATPVDHLHRFAEASATAFADRNRWVGHVPGVPTRELLSRGFLGERACGFDPAKAAARPVPFGTPDGDYGACPAPGGTTGAGREGTSTTHLNVADRWGNVVSYTLTIEQTGGSGITVPGRGFLLNNELTDFDFVPVTAGVPDPNLPGPGKRPRSSMSPTIVLRDGRPVLTVGTPGGATIITTVSQILLGTLDRGMPLVDAIAAPRISSRNTGATAEKTFLATPEAAALAAKGHRLDPVDQIGNASGIRLLPGRRFEAAAETTRGGGGSAMVVRADRNR